MSDIISQLIGGNLFNFEKDSRITVPNIIMFLLVVIIIVMAYNYWIIYSYSPQIPSNENFNSDNYTSNEHMMTNSDAPLNPTVRSVLDKVSQYKEGTMSENLKQYYNDYNSQQLNNFENTHKNQQQQQHQQQHQQQQQQNHQVLGKPEDEEDGIVKLIIYHMPGCGHCNTIMKNGPNGEKSQFDQLKYIFKDDKTVGIYDYQLGRDKEADKYRSFPTIMIISSDGTDEYRGKPDAVSMAKAIVDKKNW